MSIEAVNQFLTKVSEDKELQAEVAEAMQAEHDRQAVTELAAKHGYEFTPEELGSQIEQALKAQQGELDEAELEAVAGGICTPATTAVTVTVIPAGIGGKISIATISAASAVAGGAAVNGGKW